MLFTFKWGHQNGCVTSSFVRKDNFCFMQSEMKRFENEQMRECVLPANVSFWIDVHVDDDVFIFGGSFVDFFTHLLFKCSTFHFENLTPIFWFFSKTRLTDVSSR